MLGTLIVDATSTHFTARITPSGAQRMSLHQPGDQEGEGSPRPSNRDATSLRVARRPGAVSKHVANVLMKLGMTPSDENRRVRAVLTWLRHTGR